MLSLVDKRVVAVLLLWLTVAHCREVKPDPAVSYFAALEDLEACKDPFQLGAGAKNVVFTCSNTPDEIRRVSFWATFNDNSTTACRVDVRELVPRLEETLNDPETLTLSEKKLLQDAIFVLQHKFPEPGQDDGRSAIGMDLVARNTWKHEQLLNANAAAAGLSFGVNVPLGSIRLRLPVKNPPRCNTKRRVNDADILSTTEDYVMVVERQKRYPGSVNHHKNLTRGDLKIFLYGWLSGQIDLFDKAGTFHTDGHTGNVLYSPTKEDGPPEFFWNDFGRTTSHAGHPSHQFQKTMQKVSDLKTEYSEDLNQIISSIRVSPEPFSSEEEERQEAEKQFQELEKQQFQEIVPKFEKILDKMDQDEDIQQQRHRLGGRRMGSRVASLEVKVKELETDIQRQASEIQQLQAGRLADKAEIQQQAAEIHQLQAGRLADKAEIQQQAAEIQQLQAGRLADKAERLADKAEIEELKAERLADKAERLVAKAEIKELNAKVLEMMKKFDDPKAQPQDL
jgi:hypothetical protein